MATKSDFAQKLLYDLRLRKERMAAAQNSGNNSTSRGSHGNAGQGYKGSRQIKALESVSYRSGNSSRRTSSGARSFTTEDSSKHIVPYGGGRSPGQMGDLPTTIAFAFANGGKLSKMDASGTIPMLNLLQQIGSRSLDSGNVEIRSNFGKNNSSSQILTFSHVHINEISKGVHKLNQILRTCSNGLTFDRYSIEVGKQLLKGAMDLEESLRMLVNLQETSDYMINPQRKNKIKLLEDEEEDESESAKLTDLKLVDRPRFSFDKPSRNSRRTTESAKNGIKHQLMTLTYPEEIPRKDEKPRQSTSNSLSHSRSASCVPDYKSLSTYLLPKEESTASYSKPEKGRLSNVIAKLMGLEELPSNGDSKATQKELTSKRKEATVSKKHGISVDSQPQDTANRPVFTTRKNTASSQITPSRDSNLALKPEKLQSTPNGSSKVVISEDHSQWQDCESAARKDEGSLSKIVTIMIDKQQESRINQPDQLPQYRTILQEKGKEENNEKAKEKKITKSGERKELLSNDEMQHKAPERSMISAADSVSEKIDVKKDKVQTVKKAAGHFLSKQQKLQDEKELQQPQVLKKFVHQEEKRKQQLPKQKLLAREPKGNREQPSATSKPKTSAKALEKKQPYVNLAIASKKNPTKHIDVKPTKGLSNSKSDRERTTRETSIHVPYQPEKGNEMKIYKSKAHPKIDAVVKRRNATLSHSLRPLKPQSPVRQDMKGQNATKVSIPSGAEQVSKPQLKKADAGLTESTKPEVSSQPSNGSEELQCIPGEVTLHNSGKEEYQTLEVSKSPTSNDNFGDIAREIHEVPHECKHYQQPSVSVDDLQFDSPKVSFTQGGYHKGSKETDRVVQDEHKRVHLSGSGELLTESEKHLKEILIKGQLFLNTAEAIFRLNIPFSILHGTDHSDQDAETKLILDCGNELLKKKGRRLELAVYPSKEMSIGCVKVTSFDDLIKQLSKDFNMLKFYGGNGGDECDAADYLYKMLEKDIQNRDSDVNCMWDFSWNVKTSAFLENDDIVKDVEKHMLNGLLDEITDDLLHIDVSA